MTKTLHFSKLKEQSNDLFELVVATAKRARQINALRIAENPLPTLTEDQEETFEVTPEEEESMEDWDAMEKPVAMAIEEMMLGKLKFYHEEAQKEEAADESEILE